MVVGEVESEQFARRSAPARDAATLTRAPNLPAAALSPSQDELEKCASFIRRFRAPSAPGGPAMPLKYLELVREVKRRRLAVIDIELDDVALGVDDQALVLSIEGNAKRYVELFSRAVDVWLLEDLGDAIDTEEDTDAVMLHHRLRSLSEAQRASGEEQKSPEELASYFPPSLLRTYEIRIIPRTAHKALSLREVSGSSLGRLVQVKAMVLRTTDVKPLMQVAAYSWCVSARGLLFFCAAG